MSRIVRFHAHGGPDVLRLEEAEVGLPGSGEVRLRVEAIGLNRSEAIFRAGTYFHAPHFPSLIGYEGCGTIEALGAEVAGFSVGERVCVLPSFKLGEYGMYGDQAIVPARSLIAPPPGMSSVEAASIWMQYFTALGIYELGQVKVGDFVVIRAASSSVGLAAIQLARWAGAIPIATTRTSKKADALKAHGAAHVIATDESDLVAQIMRLTGGKGARVVFDPIGGPTVDLLAQACADEGVIIIYGGLSGQPSPYPHWPAALKSLSMRGWVASSIWNRPERFARYRDMILFGLAEKHLTPVIAKTFPLSKIVDAHLYLESNQQFGKIVVTV